MNEPTITCPKCKTEIRLTESLAAPLIEATRLQFEEKLSQKDEEIAQREQVLRDKEKQVSATQPSRGGLRRYQATLNICALPTI